MKKIFLLVALAAIGAGAVAQTQAFAISSVSGLLESKFKIKYYPEDKNLRAVNSVADTISVEEAKGIFRIAVIGRDTNRIFYKLDVKDFAMHLRHNADTATYYSHSEILTDEMKVALKKVKPGTEIYFEYIRAAWGEMWSSASMISYYVK